VVSREDWLEDYAVSPLEWLIAIVDSVVGHRNDGFGLGVDAVVVPRVKILEETTLEHKPSADRHHHLDLLPKQQQQQQQQQLVAAVAVAAFTFSPTYC